MHVLQRHLAARGIRPKQRVTRAGRTIGADSFGRGALFHLLRNRIYRGEIVHKGTVHSGLHPAIVEADLFDAVQARLDAGAQRRAGARDRTASVAPLLGRIVDAEGAPMSPSHTLGKRGQPYRYYVSARLQRGGRSGDDGTIRRVAAPALEALVSATLRRVMPRANEPLALLHRVEVHDSSLHLLLPATDLANIRARLADHETADIDSPDPTWVRLTLPIRMRLRGGRTWVLGGAAPTARPDPVLIRALRRAHAMLETDAAGLPVVTEAPASPYLRRLLRLAFLAPDLQRAILAGRQPPGLTLEQLMHAAIPLLWSDQAVLFADAAAPSRMASGGSPTP